MKVFWYDTETTGTNYLCHGIIQLAYIVEIDGVERECGTLYSNCDGKEISDDALRINGYTREQIAGFPSLYSMYCDLNDIFSKYVDRMNPEDKFTLAGYNVGGFDNDFLQRLWEECDDPYFRSWFSFGEIDPSHLARFLQYSGYTMPVKAKLTTLAEHFGCLRANAHDAVEDVRMTIDLAHKFQEILGLRKSIPRRVPI